MHPLLLQVKIERHSEVLQSLMSKPRPCCGLSFNEISRPVRAPHSPDWPTQKRLKIIRVSLISTTWTWPSSVPAWLWYSPFSQTPSSQVEISNSIFFYLTKQDVFPVFTGCHSLHEPVSLFSVTKHPHFAGIQPVQNNGLTAFTGGQRCRRSK